MASPLSPFPAGTVNGMSVSSTGSVKSFNINRVLYIENLDETLIEHQLEPQTPTEGENQDHTKSNSTYPAASSSVLEQTPLHSSGCQQPHVPTHQNSLLPSLHASFPSAVEDIHSPFNRSGIDGLAYDAARDDQVMRDSAQTDIFTAQQPVVNDPVAIKFGRASGRVVMLGENKSTPAVVSSSAAKPRPLPSPPPVAPVDDIRSQKANMVDLPRSTPSSFNDSRRFNWNGPASDGHSTEPADGTAASEESHNTAASAPQLHLPPPPSVPPPASSSSHTTTAHADLPLLMASHLLSTHAAALMQNSNNLKDLGELMHRMARESLDWGNVLMGMTMKGKENQVQSEEDRRPTPFPFEGPPSSVEQGETEPDREVLVTPDVGEADRLTPIPARPSLTRIRTQSKLSTTSDTHTTRPTTPPQHDHVLSQLAAAGQADIQASIQWLDEAERLGREGWTSIHQAEAAWMNAMSSLRAMVNSTQALALQEQGHIQRPPQDYSQPPERVSSSPLESSNDHSTGYTENDLGFESPLHRKSTNHARPGSRMTGGSATRVGSGSGPGTGRKLSKRSGPVTTSVREIRLGQTDDRNFKGKRHWWSRRRSGSGSMSTLRA
ncbi:hypothetical protein BCR39DRAFT_544980 [Naematelia encephala]|uniref:Uncharacterized protein n=1 Tax=Naematelia encephala TaxID=71784 RepID=A0A1Y2ARK7_9TREE|nr:hypothetical protein BCR39DRAFT_544980 [Naematelia encephala]